MDDPETIPMIDMAPLLGGTPGAAARVAADIGAACRSTGFFSIAGHGIDPALLASVYGESARFFALPEAEKQALAISRFGDNRGYAGFGSESLDPDKPADAKEAFNIGRDEPPDINHWPALPGFVDVMSRYYAAMRRLSEQLHRAIAIDLALDPDFFARRIDRPQATLRLLHYPPHPGRFDGDRYGAGAHTDYGNVTILSQDMVGGLEVRTRDGRWIAATPVPGTFVCNIGDCLMRWSNDVYVSTPHRVANLSGRERYSVAFFFDPNPDALVACLPTCTDAGRPARYPPILAADYLRERLDATYAHRQKG
ncbi:isopenicillin N synthase family dioxygenase [Sphingomonas sanxanigenens]|uniref:2-oxoglutarate-dependent ethylene/succinate-forming enzyme n=1 Tax=Sphingomonas sanxanigenens DSM 19645 = NX02 TaxID=1123269 RepID=W0AF21_9SPHN|nr:2-oxoglutarate and iron-dependent oxygenase domain-containing protein [Sphingomonas sanxanigenens]AHE54898.1 hypothetical protein NX02_16090 [Sphingomonas sanxanigenens DSM 19645 = NX02]